MKISNPLTIPRGDLRYLRIEQEVACLSTDNVGDWVCGRGDATETGRWRVQRANPYDIEKIPAIGLLVEKITPTAGTIQVFGTCDYYIGLDVTRPAYFLGSDGRLSFSQPDIGGNAYVFVQMLGTPVSSDLMIIGEKLNLMKRVS